jgi:hypothetical protein
MAERIRTVRTHYDGNAFGELGLEAEINKIGYENVLQILPCYCGCGEYFYTIIYREQEDTDG